MQCVVPENTPSPLTRKVAGISEGRGSKRNFQGKGGSRWGEGVTKDPLEQGRSMVGVLIFSGTTQACNATHTDVNIPLIIVPIHVLVEQYMCYVHLYRAFCMATILNTYIHASYSASIVPSLVWFAIYHWPSSRHMSSYKSYF